jgi:hypothetical protein
MSMWGADNKQQTRLKTGGRNFTLSPVTLNVIYLDHNATTPIAPEVLEAMMPYLTSEWRLPSKPDGPRSKAPKPRLPIRQRRTSGD